jgi:hypothetical protein
MREIVCKRRFDGLGCKEIRWTQFEIEPLTTDEEEAGMTAAELR